MADEIARSEHVLDPAAPAIQGVAAGVAVDPSVPATSSDVLMSHAAWEEAYEDELAAAWMYAASHRAHYIAQHGSDEGYVPQREFPCPGMLRVEDRCAVMWVIECDACGYETSIRAPARILAQQRLERSGIPPAFLTKPFDKTPDQEDVLGVCRQWIRDFKPGKLSENLPAIALYGPPGRGKSHLLALICRTLIENHHADVLYRSAEELFDALRAGMDDKQRLETRYEQVWRGVLNAPVLALDDVAATRMTEWKQERLQTLVDYRFSRELPLLIATNVAVGGWEQTFGDRTNSRLRAMCVRLKFEGPDRRAGMGVQQELVA